MSFDVSTNLGMAYFGAPDTRTIITSELAPGVVGISRVRANYPLGVIDYNVIEDAIMVAYQHRQIRCDLFLEDRLVPVPGASAARATVYDYRRRWNCELMTGIDATNFFVPRATLDTISEGAALSDVTVRPGEIIDDQVVNGLVAALERAFETPRQANPLFLDHLGWAFAAHCAATFLAPQSQQRLAKGRLAPWQLRLAKEMISARLNGDLTVAELAAACGLSIAHFARAFRLSTGVPPYRWLMNQRIDRARHLLLTTRASVAEIALECGFTDQIHLTHAFTRHVGTAPGGWRRDRHG